jgi:hypothetical protein
VSIAKSRERYFALGPTESDLLLALALPTLQPKPSDAACPNLFQPRPLFYGRGGRPPGGRQVRVPPQATRQPTHLTFRALDVILIEAINANAVDALGLRAGLSSRVKLVQPPPAR